MTAKLADGPRRVPPSDTEVALRALLRAVFVDIGLLPPPRARRRPARKT